MPRRRRSRGPLARLAVPVAIPLALIVAVGAVIAVVDHSGANTISDASANCASPAAYVVQAKPGSGSTATSDTASPTAAASGTATATATVSVAATPTVTASVAASATTAASGTASPTAAASGTATASTAASSATSPTTATVPTTTATTTAAPTTTAPTTTAPLPSNSASAAPCPSSSATTTAAANVNCDIIVPANPLSARGLATPYQLTGPDGMSPEQSGCTMANATALGAFVQATILNTQTGQLSVYDPLVITQGTTPAVAPVVPTLPRHYVATIDFGFNGTDLTQVGATANALRQGNCVNGRDGAEFGQVSFCNGTSFFNKAFQLERAGRLKVPSAGTSGKIVASGGKLGSGQTCPTVRNFEVIDQDQSDNVTTVYLFNPATGQTAQDTTANAGSLPGSTMLVNGSDNALVDLFLDPTFGCTPFSAPDLANNGQPTSSQALDELLAAGNQTALTALVPENDEMVLDGNGNLDAAKTNLYRQEVGQAPISNQNNKQDSPAMYCQNMVNIQTAFLAANQGVLAAGTSPVPAVGNNLFTFLANRLSMSFTNLNCQNFGLTNPVSVTLDGNGVGIAATFNTTTQTVSTGTSTPGHAKHRGRSHHQLMDPSGM